MAAADAGALLVVGHVPGADEELLQPEGERALEPLHLGVAAGDDLGGVVVVEDVCVEVVDDADGMRRHPGPEGA